MLSPRQADVVIKKNYRELLWQRNEYRMLPVILKFPYIMEIKVIYERTLDGILQLYGRCWVVFINLYLTFNFREGETVKIN